MKLVLYGAAYIKAYRRHDSMKHQFGLYKYVKSHCKVHSWAPIKYHIATAKSVLPIKGTAFLYGTACTAYRQTRWSSNVSGYQAKLWLSYSYRRLVIHSYEISPVKIRTLLRIAAIWLPLIYYIIWVHSRALIKSTYQKYRQWSWSSDVNGQ